MVVDDSVVVRRIISDVLDGDPGIEVVATAANGQIALDKLDTVRPDLITLDIEMPVMDGLETLRNIRRRDRRVPIVMFSTLTERGAAATLDALASGASDFVTKPANVGSVTKGMQAVRDELIPKVLQLCGRTAPPHQLPTPPARTAIGDRPVAAAPLPTRRLRPGGTVTAVVVGVSTGGPNALAAIWPQLTKLTVPVLIVQHMPPVFTTMLAKRLDALGTVPVTEAFDDAPIVAGSALLAPGGHHMVVASGASGPVVRLNDDPPEHSCRPAVDVLFRSAAATFGAGTLALVLTGMGMDGAAGAAAIRDAGGSVIVQDEATSVVWGMPGAVSRAGLADEELPLDRIASALVERAAQRRMKAGVV